MDDYIRAARFLEEWGTSCANPYKFDPLEFAEMFCHQYGKDPQSLDNISFFIMPEKINNFAKLYKKEIGVGKYKVTALGDFKHLFILNKNTIKGDGSSEIAVHRFIDFDSNMVSFCRRPNNDMKLVIANIKSAISTSASPEPYLLENIVNSYDFHSSRNSIKNSLSSFSSAFENKTDLDNLLDKLDKKQKPLKKYYSDYKNQLKALMYHACYTRLFSNESEQDKVIDLLRFVNKNKLKLDNNVLYLLGLLVIGDKSVTMRFAHPIQLNANIKKLIHAINGMVIDLLILRSIQHNISRDYDSSKNILYLHELATQDVGLNNLIEGNKITRFAIIKDQKEYGNSFIPHFEHSILDLLNDRNKNKVDFIYDRLQESLSSINNLTISSENLKKLATDEKNIFISKFNNY